MHEICAANSRKVRGNWTDAKAALRTYWPRLTERDVTTIEGGREALMRTIKARYDTSYGQIEREVTEFELRDVRSAYAARPSLGILNDG